MAVTSQRSIVIALQGDANGTTTYPATANGASPGTQDIVSLASGNNTITVPIVTGFTITAVTIVPPATNTVQMILKGVAGDTGILLHLTDPTSIALAPGQASFVLNAANTLPGVRLVWS